MHIDPEHLHLVTGPVAEQLADVYRRIGHNFREMKEEELREFKERYLMMDELHHTALADAALCTRLIEPVPKTQAERIAWIKANPYPPAS